MQTIQERACAVMMLRFAVVIIGLVVVGLFDHSALCEAASTAPKVVLADFHNNATIGGAELASAAKTALVSCLTDAPCLRLVPSEQVRQAMEQKGLKPSCTQQDLIALGNACGGDRVCGGAIVKTTQVKGVCSLELQTTTYEVSSGRLVGKTRSLAAGKNPSGNPEIWKQLARSAASDAAQQMRQLHGLRGIALSQPREGHVRISIGTRQVLRPGAEVVFCQKENAVSSGTVIEVDIVDALVRVNPTEDARRVDRGDAVQVIYNPPQPLALPGGTEAENIAKEEKDFEIAFVVPFAWLLSIAAGL